MTALFVIVGVGLLLAAAMVLTDRWSARERGPDRLAAPPYPDPGEWTGLDVREVTFRPALRGYRMEEVDAMLESLAAGLPDTLVVAAPEAQTGTLDDGAVEDEPGEEAPEPPE